jgi:hypothetical protein
MIIEFEIDIGAKLLLFQIYHTTLARGISCPSASLNPILEHALLVAETDN